MFDKKKYFQKTITQWIVKPLKKYGFKRYNQNNVARLTKDHIVQVINFQKSRWGGNFYVNITNIPLFKQQYDFSGEGGDRIENMVNISNQHGSFNYDIKVLGDINFENIQKAILNAVLPWFDQTATVKGLLEYNNYLLKESKIINFGAIRGEQLGYLLLANKQYEKAREYFYTQELRKYDQKTDSYTYFRNKTYDPIINLIDSNSVEAHIENNILYNQTLLKNKLPSFSTPICHLSETIELITTARNTISKNRYDNGINYYHHIYDASPEKRDLITEIETVLKPSRNINRLSDNQLDIIINDDYRLHFVVRKDTYEDEIPYIIDNYSGTKSVEKIINGKERIEFWGDKDNSDFVYINDYIIVLEALNSIKNISIYWPKNNIFFDEN